MYNFQGFMNTTYDTMMKNQTTTVEFVPISTGVVDCRSSYARHINAKAQVIVSDLDDDFMIWPSVDKNSKIYVGEDISLNCGASRHITNEAVWYKDGIPVKNDSGNLINVSILAFAKH